MRRDLCKFDNEGGDEGGDEGDDEGDEGGDEDDEGGDEGDATSRRLVRRRHSRVWW